MTNRNTYSGKLTLFLATLTILIACQPSPDEGQDQNYYGKIAALFEFERLERLGELPEDKKQLLAELRQRGMVPANKEEIEWFLEAAGRGDDPFTELKKKRKQELDQLRNAAKQGDTKAQFELGRMYANGEGVPENYVQGVLAGLGSESVTPPVGARRT